MRPKMLVFAHAEISPGSNGDGDEPNELESMG